MFLYADCHSHLAECFANDKKSVISLLERDDYSVLSSVHSIAEFDAVCFLKNRYPHKIGIGYGVLPQKPVLENLSNLKSLLENPETSSIIAIFTISGLFILTSTSVVLIKKYKPRMKKI